MATSLDRVQSSPLAVTDTIIYTCPPSTKTVISNINVCNKSATQTSFRLYVKALGTTDYYLYYDVTVPGNDTFNRVAGDVIKATDVLYVRATLATLDFTISYIENT